MKTGRRNDVKGHIDPRIVCCNDVKRVCMRTKSYCKAQNVFACVRNRVAKRKTCLHAYEIVLQRCKTCLHPYDKVATYPSHHQTRPEQMLTIDLSLGVRLW